MENEELIIKNIQSLGNEYYRKNLKQWNKETLQENWWEALKFFFSHSFMRGRRDELSNEYYFFTIESLKDYFSITENQEVPYTKLKGQKKKDFFNIKWILDFKKQRKLGKKNSIRHEDFRNELSSKNPIIELLITKRYVQIGWYENHYLKEVYLGNDEDIMMVLDVLNFISSNDDKKNIYAYIKNEIVNNGLEKVYKELKGIRAIADKISTFIIRDILILNPEIKIKEQDYRWAFPMDFWVQKIASKLGCNYNNEKTRIYLIKKCLVNNANPIKFAAGLWFLGFHSLDILVDKCIGRINIE